MQKEDGTTKDPEKSQVLLKAGLDSSAPDAPVPVKTFDLLLESEEATDGAKRWCILAVLWFGQFLIFVSICSLAPFYPEEAEKKNATATEYGLIIAVYQIANLLSCPVFAKLGGVIREKNLVVSGLVVASIATTSFGFIDHLDAGEPYLTGAFLLRIVNGIGSAAFQITSYVVVACIFPKNIATAFATMETAVGLGYIVGPTIGGLLFELGGFMLPFVVNGCLVFLIAIVALILVPVTESTENQQISCKAMLRILLYFDIVLSVFAIICSEGISGFMVATLEPFLRQFHLRPLYVGLVFVAEGICYTITTPVWGYLKDRGVSPLLACLVGCCFCISGVAFIGPLPFFPIKPSLWLVVLSLCLIGLGQAPLMVCAFTSMLHDAWANGYADDKTTYALISALFNSACGVASSVGPAAGGFLLDELGFRSATIVLLSVIFFLTLLYVIQIVRQYSHPCLPRSRIPVQEDPTIV